MKLTKLFAVAGMLLAFTAFTASSLSAKKTASNGNKLKVVATIFPEYDWVREIVGEKSDDVELTLLMSNGVDLHSYSPSVKDIAKISDSDIFIYVGGESDEWVEDVLRNASNKNLRAINLLEVLGDKVKEEEVVEGMQSEEDDEHEHHHHDGEHEDDHEHDDEEGDEEEEIEYDEHVWLSLRNAQILSAEIAKVLSEKDAKNAAVYQKNLAAYNKRLSDLDARYVAAVKAGDKNTVLFGDRFPFRYLVDDYNLKYYAAFVGCSAESEASFNTIVFLSEKVNELNLQAVCQIETGNGKIAKTIISNSNNKKAKILTFDSLQSTTAKQIKKGATYIGAMEKNLEVLEEALK